MNWRQIIFLCCFLIFGESLIAQNSKRIVLVEHFTNTECPVCTSRNPGLHSTLEKYPGQARHISYHHDSPYPSCVYYQANKDGNQGRSDFYNASGSPRAYVDGVKTSGSSLLSEDAVDNALAVPALIEISVTEDVLSASVSIKTTGNVPSENLRLFVALVERETDYNSPNGEKKHYNVFRKFVNANGPDGQAFTAAAMDESVSFNYNFGYEQDWQADQMYVLAFVQDISAKKILNAATKDDQTTSSVTNFLDESLIRLSPNPVQDILQITADENTLLEGEMKIYTMSGQLVKRQTTTPTNNLLQIEMKEEAAGVYIVQIESEVGILSKKFVKQ